jgi:hypothetical protein
MNNRGSFTVESIISVSFVVIIIVIMINYLNMFFIHETINQALLKTALTLNKSNESYEKTFFDHYKTSDDLVEFGSFDRQLKPTEEVLNLSYAIDLLSKSVVFEKKLKINKFVNSKNQYYVYITNTGSKYHLNDCRYLYNSKIKVTLHYALINDYGPCKICIGGISDPFKN